MSDDAEEIVYQILMADEAVVAMIGEQNAHENFAPLGAEPPNIVYTRAATIYNPSIHSSASGLQEVTIEIACNAKSAKQARALRKLVDAIETRQWVKVGCGAVYDMDTENHEQIVTVVVTEQ